MFLLLTCIKAKVVRLRKPLVYGPQELVIYKCGVMEAKLTHIFLKRAPVFKEHKYILEVRVGVANLERLVHWVIDGEKTCLMIVNSSHQSGILLIILNLLLEL